MFSAFDCPDGGQIMPARPRSTTPIQALNLLNSPFIVAQAEALADRVRAETHDGADRQIARMFHLVCGHDPDADELGAARVLVASHGLTSLARALYNSDEFLQLP